jgi:hypothetical protein
MTIVQDYIDGNKADGSKRFDKASITKIEIREKGIGETENDEDILIDKLTGKLTVKNFLKLTEINLEGHELEEAIFINCPLLEKINVGTNKITKLDFTKLKTSDGAETGNPAPGDTLKNLIIDNNPDLEEVSLEYCPNLGIFNARGDTKLKKVWKLDHLKKLHTVLVAEGLVDHINGEKLKHFREIKKIIREILGLGTEYPIDTIDLKTKIENKILDAIKAELGLVTGATHQQIIDEIKKLKGPGYVSKVSLTSDAKDSLAALGFSEADINKELSAAASARDVEVSRNKLVGVRFNELQRKLHNAHYLSIGLGTLSVVLLLILT